LRFFMPIGYIFNAKKNNGFTSISSFESTYRAPDVPMNYIAIDSSKALYSN
jgi:hypothetical protein